MPEPTPRVMPLDRALTTRPPGPLERVKAWAQDDQNWLLRPQAEANVERRAETVVLGHRASWPGLLLLPLLALTANGRLPVIGTAVLWADRALNREEVGASLAPTSSRPAAAAPPGESQSVTPMAELAQVLQTQQHGQVEIQSIIDSINRRTATLTGS